MWKWLDLVRAQSVIPNYASVPSILLHHRPNASNQSRATLLLPPRRRLRQPLPQLARLA